MNRRISAGILVLRIAVAIVFLYHGSAILFGAFGGPGPVGFATYLHYPASVGYLVGLAQFAGGLAILFGAFTRVAAICIMIVMLGAIFKVHISHGYNLGNNGYEFALNEFLTALTLLFTGPGAYSLASALPPTFREL